MWKKVHKTLMQQNEYANFPRELRRNEKFPEVLKTLSLTAAFIKIHGAR